MDIQVFKRDLKELLKDIDPRFTDDFIDTAGIKEPCVDLDLAIQWTGYSKKKKVLEILKKQFVRGVDYILEQKTRILLTPDCFKALAMQASTENGRKTRMYYIALEKAYVELMITKNKELTDLSQQLKKDNETLQKRIDSIIATGTFCIFKGDDETRDAYKFIGPGECIYRRGCINPLLTEKVISYILEGFREEKDIFRCPREHIERVANTVIDTMELKKEIEEYRMGIYEPYFQDLVTSNPADIVTCFMEEKLRPGEKISLEELYETFKKWCPEGSEAFQLIDPVMFGRKISEKFEREKINNVLYYHCEVILE